MVSYLYETLALLSIFVIASVSLNVVVGQGGLLSLMHGALIGIGAYVTAILAVQVGMPMAVAGICAIVLTTMLASILAVILVNLDEEQFAVTTLAIHLLIINILTNWKALTRGPYGIAGIPRMELLGIFAPRLEFAILCIILAIGATVLVARLSRTGFFRLMRASAGDAEVVEGLGASVRRLRAVAFAVGGCGAGLAGALYAMHYGYIAPQLFGLHLSILVLAMVVVGGARGTAGAVTGAAILVLLPEALRFAALPVSAAGPVRQVIFGLLLVLAVYLRCGGRPRGWQAIKARLWGSET